ncbi:hypothetical protein SmJEL517_g05641 [Synchytrium microbalum]|uniref:SHSP domain-containing protein n=1 Tax=Synchytrium microbalum TaxID=1806994 RepID=A0A507BUD1_9FUNG|nr:uncharacterized protein SmJEL517_g05641 [Synchytrium microbalum]TPX30898.1 hypothetical protein SmJEL517_g05641 [Synchytrium microbalum]
MDNAAATLSSPARGPRVMGLLKLIMDVESTTNNEEGVAKVLSKYLVDQLGWKSDLRYADPGRPNVLAVPIPQRTWECKILMNSHIDTVPPYIPYSEDHENIYGRGSCDAKGSIAAQVVAVQELLEEGRIKAGDVAVCYVIGEEKDHNGIIKMNNEEGLTPRYMIVGEPTESKLARGHKGVLKAVLKTTGKAGHSGYPEVGASAIDAMSDIVARLARTQFPVDPQLGKTTCNVGSIHGGAAPNVIAASCIAEILVRVSTTVEEATSVLQRVVDEVKFPGVEVQLTVTGREGVRCHTVDIGIETFAAAYFTDIGYYTGPAKPLLFGPGTILVAHSEKEFVGKRELVDSFAEGYDQPINTGLGDIAHRFPRHVPSRVLSLTSGAVVWRPACDIWDTDNAIVVHIDLPGVPKSEIGLDVVQDQLTVSGTHQGPAGFESASSCVRERNIGSFRKIVRLPGNVDVSKVTAEYQDGLLEVKIPKTPPVHGQKIHIA